MRVRVGQMVNADAEVNLADLKPLDRIIAAAVNAYHNTKMYQRRYAETEERRQEQARKVREALIDNLMSVITSELEQNSLLKDRGDSCQALLLEVPPRFQRYLHDIVDAHEFAAYEITVIPPNAVLSKFANPPHLLFISNKGG